MKLHEITIGALTLLVAWFALDFIGAPGLVDKEPLISLAGLMLACLSIVAGAGLVRAPFVAPIYFLALMVWAVLQFDTHWSTYLAFDASERKLAWYQRVFGHHWRFLPSTSGRTTPDGYHTVLALLIIVNVLLAAWDCLRSRRLSPPI